MLKRLVETCEDERDRLSSTRTPAMLLVLVSLVLLVISIAVISIYPKVAARCFEAFKYLLGPTGPIILLLGAGQAKTMGTSIANAFAGASVQNSVTVTTTTPHTGTEKRKRTPSNAAQADQDINLPPKPPAGPTREQ